MKLLLIFSPNLQITILSVFWICLVVFLIAKEIQSYPSLGLGVP
jgi:hypothetical protein